VGVSLRSEDRDAVCEVQHPGWRRRDGVVVEHRVELTERVRQLDRFGFEYCGVEYDADNAGESADVELSVE
jgi:hypothetical protein